MAFESEKTFVAFAIDGGTAQVSRYRVTASNAEQAQQRLAEMGLLITRVQPIWLYFISRAAAAGIAASLAIVVLWAVIRALA